MWSNIELSRCTRSRSDPAGHPRRARSAACTAQELGRQGRQWERNVSYGSMLSKKSLGGNKRNFLKLLMRFVRSDVRGPHRFSEKRPRTVVSTLSSIAAAE